MTALQYHLTIQAKVPQHLQRSADRAHLLRLLSAVLRLHHVVQAPLSALEQSVQAALAASHLPRVEICLHGLGPVDGSDLIGALRCLQGQASRGDP